MCDSITILVLLEDQSQTIYNRCHYPTRGKEDLDEVSNDFRDQYPTSPLTGAGFRVTAVGYKLSSEPDAGSIEKNRKKYGRVAGYIVDFNPPACTVGHNRLLVNGVPAATEVGIALLKHWLVENGCAREGLDAIKTRNTEIISVTPTFLFECLDESEARLNLAQIRGRSEAICNTHKRASKTKPPAFSVPPTPPKDGDYIYTSYIKQREYSIDCYVKKFGANKAFYLPIANNTAEFVVEQISKRTLRIGTKLHGKWLKDNGLNKAACWLGSNEGYKKAFALIRSTLRLDEELRTKQIRSKTIAALNLRKSDLTLLRYHVGRNIAREHPQFDVLSAKQASKAYSASRLRILSSTRIDLDINYDDQLKSLFPSLTELVVFPGQYVPGEQIAEFIFSPVSVPIALKKLEHLTQEVLRNYANALARKTEKAGQTATRGSAALPRAGDQIRKTIRYTRCISRVPIDPDALE